MFKKFSIFSILFVYFAFSATIAQASCNFQGYTFLLSNDNVSVSVLINSEPSNYGFEITDPRVCRHNFSSNGPTSFDSISIETKPKNGTLVQRNVSSFEYKPRSGFLGADLYTVKICGNRRGQTGCSKITYKITVR